MMESFDTTHYGASDRRPETNGSAEQLATALGWFSIGLGLAEIAAPSRLARLIGVPDEDGTYGVLRAYGMREIAAGIGILAQPRPAGWMWGRVVGDLLDLASLGSAMGSKKADSSRIATATAAVLGVTVLDAMVARQLSDTAEIDGDHRSSFVHSTKSILINRSPDEVYKFWRNFENLPRFMNYLESVEVISDRRSRWRVNAAGVTLQWEAEITSDEPGRHIVWRSLGSADVENRGEVEFEEATGGRGSYVKVRLDYNPPGGRIGAAIAKMFAHSPEQLIGSDLRRFKQIMEVGEVVHSDASIHAGMHPGQPPERIPEPVQEWQPQHAL